MSACERLLTAIIPILSSHVIYGTRSSGPFTRDMKAVERNAILRDLLESKGIGLRLCQLFRQCWGPSVMAEHLEKAAAFTRSRDSSLNITDTVQAMFQSSFTDFMVVMTTRLNEGRNLDMLFTGDNTKILQDLFCSLISTLTPPKLAQLKVLAGSLVRPSPCDYQPMFPFFK